MEQLLRGAWELSQGGQEVKHSSGSLRERAGGSGGEEAKHSPHPHPHLSKEVLVKIRDL